MKYISIVFATGLSLLTLLGLDTLDTLVKKYSSFDDFVTDLKNTAINKFDYVSKIQAVFCPNQPICGVEGMLERRDVLGTLPAELTVGNRTVRLEDIPSFAGICCLPCSCSDSCRQNDNCCPTKQMLPDKNNLTRSQGEECIAATVYSYTNKQHYDTTHIDHMYRMVTHCFHDDANITHLTKCPNPDIGRLSDNIPVTSQTTGITYWNMHCAICNNDAKDLIGWTGIVIFKQTISLFSNSSFQRIYPDSYEELLKQMTKPRNGDIIYVPPTTSIKPSQCLRMDVILDVDCIESTEKNWLSQSCRQFGNPVTVFAQKVLYKNVFCSICGGADLADQRLTCVQTEEKGSAFQGHLTGLLRYNQNADDAVSQDGGLVVQECGCREIFDPYVKLCRPIFCPAGEVYVGCTCTQLLERMSGMPVLLKFEMSTTLDGAHQLSGKQIRKFDTVLNQTLADIAKHTTTQIATIFRSKNVTKDEQYLIAVIMLSDPGQDTKLAVKPLMTYLDTNERITLKVGTLDFTAVLTSKVLFWPEKVDHTGNYFKTQVLNKPASVFIPIYTNKVLLGQKYMRQNSFQPLSRLLYCKQVQLNETEFFESTGLISINVTVPTFEIFDYTRATRSHVRVCVDEYLQESKAKLLSGNAFKRVNTGIVLISFASAMFIKF